MLVVLLTSRQPPSAAEMFSSLALPSALSVDASSHRANNKQPRR